MDNVLQLSSSFFVEATGLSDPVFLPYMLVSLFTSIVSRTFIAYVEIRIILEYVILLSAHPHSGSVRKDLC